MSIVRFYNKNRKTIWLMIIVILFVLFIINVLNNFYAERSRRRNNSTSQQLNETKTYENQSEAMVQGQITSEKKKQKFGELIDEFLEYCNNNQIEKAYGLLSNACREKLYPTQDSFYNEYYSKIFDSKKSYEFQLWSAIDETYVYLIKIFEDMLSTGIAGDQNYVQEYISVVEEQGQYKLNIDGLVKTIDYNKSEMQDDIQIQVVDCDEYMDYSIYHLKVKNGTDKNILLNPIDSEETINVEDNERIEFDAVLMELLEDDLFIQKNDTKEITVKYLRAYSTQTYARKLNFLNVIKDYDVYSQNKENYEDITKIVIDL